MQQTAHLKQNNVKGFAGVNYRRLWRSTNGIL